MKKINIQLDSIKIDSNYDDDVKQQEMNDEVAIIGISLKMPKAESVEKFWNNIKSGIDCVGDFPLERRRDINQYLSYMNEETKCDDYIRGAYLSEIDKFDYSFFHLSPKEASLMNPAQRLFLETAYEALEDAGYGGNALSGSDTGVYLGFIGDLEGYKYKQMILDVEDPSVKELCVAGNLSSIIPSRISYLLDLKGPSMLVDTACSSSLVAVHLACQALANGDCEQAIAGGIRISLLPVSGEVNIGIESSDGVTRAFDNNSDGTGVGEGVAAVLLKPLKKAIRDRDNIYAVIKGSAINQDGASAGITAPNSIAQSEVIMKAWKSAGIKPESVTYLETHGTGTKLGDPIEIDGMKKAFEKYTKKKQFCGIGSLKTNIGHLYECAGIASMIKAALALKYQQLPPSINFKIPNRRIVFENSPVYVNERLRKWECEKIRRCGISAFGFSGTNCHVVLEEVNCDTFKPKDMICIPNVLTISAKSDESLKKLLEKYEEFFDNDLNADIRDIAYTSNVGRGHYNHRLAIIFDHTEDLIQKISQLVCYGYHENCNSDIFYYEVKKDRYGFNENLDCSREQLRSIAGQKLNKYIADKKSREALAEICELYVNGTDINWKEMYAGEERYRKSIPLYAFEKNRCWITIGKLSKKTEDDNIISWVRKYNASQEMMEEITTTIERWKEELLLNLPENEPEIIKIELEGRENSIYSEYEIQLAEIWEEVLGFKKIDIRDNFFQVGGDSISMVKIINKIRDCFQIELGYNEFMEENTIEKIAKMLSLKKREDKKSEYAVIVPDKDKMYLPFETTEVQMAYLMGRDEKVEMGGISTHVYIEIETGLDIGKLNLALQKVIGRHPMLRAVFLPDGRQRILNDIPRYVIETIDMTKDQKVQQDDYILNERNRMSHQVFDSEQWPLFEIKALKLSDDLSYLFFSIDMLIADGTSLQIMSSELMEYYCNPEINMEDINFSFRDYMIGYQDFKETDTYQKDKEYWLNKLDEFPTAPRLPLKRNPESIRKPHFKRLSKLYRKQDWDRVKAIAKSNNLSASAILCTIYADVLSYWSNQTAVAINLTVFNRYPFHEEVHKLIGDFTSIMILGLELETCNEFVKRASYVQNAMMEALEHRHYDGVEFIREIAKRNNMGAKPVMPFVFTSMLNSRMSSSWNRIGNVKMGISQTPQVYIDFQAVETDGELQVTWDYAEELFEAETIEIMFEQYITSLMNFANGDTESGISLDACLWNKINSYNNTMEEIAVRTLHEMCTEQAGKTPENIAVICKGNTINYEELDKRSNRIAHYLRKNSIGKNNYIGVYAIRCIETIINILGILKAGAAYIPIDAAYPKERIDYIMSSSGCSLLLSPGFYEENHISEYPDDYIENINTLEDTAYIIYTSGSTGEPKGVVITHGAVTNTILDINQKFNVDDKDVFIGISSMCFDLSVYDMFGSLSTGASLVVIQDQRDMEELIETVNTYGITVWNSVPAIMNMVVEGLKINYKNISLRLVLLSGDWIPVDLPQKIMDKFTEAKVISLGGATEASIWSVYYPITEVKEEWKSIPYGIPLSNQMLYVLNSKKIPCPIGVEGEIYIGGAGVANGYANDAEKTKNAFLNHPQFGYLYRTGDYGVLSPEGYIIFSGRKDYQVKIRGYRIELGEIEKNLLKMEDINNAAVEPRMVDGKQSLCAYYVSKTQITPLNIREHLLNYLPGYMVPSYYIPLDSIPLTSNGKYDRKRLPEPDMKMLCQSEFAEARNEVEETLIRIWREVLGVDRLGIHDNFYEMGGDSIKAIQIASRLQKYSYKANMGDLFKYNTIAELSCHVTTISIQADQGVVEGEVLLTPVQRWFFENNFTHENHWNQSVMLYRHNSFDEELIINVFDKIVEHHDALRMSFKAYNGRTIQKNMGLDRKAYELESVDLRGGEDQKISKEEIYTYQSGLNLETGPVFKLVLFKTDKGDKLLISIHHLVIDGVSWRILFEDFDFGYTQALKHQEIKFQPKTTSYKDWSNALQIYADSDTLQYEIEYWEKTEKTIIEELPKDFDVQLSLGKDYSEITVNLNTAETQALLKEANKAYNTEINDILLTALGLAFKEWTKHDSVLINLETHGRENIIEDIDISRTVGWFTAMYPFVLDMSNSEDMSRFIKETKENIRHVPQKGIGYGILRYLAHLESKKNISFHLKPEISFNYLGQFDQDINTDTFSILNENIGLSVDLESENPYTFMIIGMIAEGEFRVTFHYNTLQYRRDSVVRLADSYKKNLKEIILHCTEREEELTPADFDDDNLSVRDLENILDYITALE